MIDFIQFDDGNPEHIKLAENDQEIIFEDYDGVLRFGWLNEKYHGNGTSTYVFVSNGETYRADCNYFALVNRKSRNV